LPEIRYEAEIPALDTLPLVAVGVAEGADPASLPFGADTVRKLIDKGDFRGEALETSLVYPPEGGPERLLVVGLGKAAEVDLSLLRRWACHVARHARRIRITAYTLLRPAGAGADGERIMACAQGTVLGARYLWRESGNPALERVGIAGPLRPKEGERAATAGLRIAEAALFARHLAMEPANRLNPAALAAEATRIAEEEGAILKVLKEEEIKDEGLRTILAVGSGSVNPPRLIHLEYDGSNGKGPTVVLVGKGVTFDSGGLSLKPAERMIRMKYDMSGAAAVLAATRGAARLRLPLRIVAVVPSAENMPGPRSYRPGDVIETYKGITVEVDNTDAEGRLLLADGLAWAEKNLEPDEIIDVATLTGACRVALGRHAAGLFTREDALAEDLFRASHDSGEKVWRLPLWDAYTRELESDAADLKNVAGAKAGAGASVAAGFLGRFVETVNWAHLDIAGMAWAEGSHDLGPKGPTGFGAALLLCHLRRRALNRRK
jgi:leucyl aminopeptidase